MLIRKCNIAILFKGFILKVRRLKVVNVLTVKDVARVLKTSEAKVRMRVYRGQLPARKLGGRIIFLEDELKEYLKNLPKVTPTGPVK